MTKLLIYPSSYEQIKDLENIYDGFIIGLENLSVNCPYVINRDKLDTIITNSNNKEVFICLNKNMFNSDIEYLKETLLYINNKNINGIFFYDLSVLKLVKELKINIPLVWSQEHLTTNYLTCNYYALKGVNFVNVSAEITLKEIIEIKEKSALKLIVPLFGYLPMFNSRRHIVDNYINTFILTNKTKLSYMYKENNYYPILDDTLGTTAYSSHILNGLEELMILKNYNVDYITLNSFNIDNEIFKKVLKIYNEANDNNVKKLNEEINEILNTDKGFLYKETIYKVKKNDK